MAKDREPVPPTLQEHPATQQRPAPRREPGEHQDLAENEKILLDPRLAIGRVPVKKTVKVRGVDQQIDQDEFQWIGDKAPADCRLFGVTLENHLSQVPDPDKSSTYQEMIPGPNGLPPVQITRQANVYLRVPTLLIWATDKGDAREIFEAYNGIRHSSNRIAIEEVEPWRTATR